MPSDALTAFSDLPRSGYHTWTMAVLAPDQVHAIVDGQLVINLSRLQIGDAQALGALPFTEIVQVIRDAVGATPYFDDKGRLSWGRFSPAESLVATLWIRLRGLVLADSKGKSIKPLPPLNYPPGSLAVRIGSVEGAALYNWLTDRQGTLAAASKAMEIAADAIERRQALPKGPWWPRLDPVDNVLLLSSNAGWYADANMAGQVFDDWAGRYVRGITAGTLMSGQMGGFLRGLPYLDGRLPTGTFNGASVIQAMAGRRVLVVSPMMDLISRQFAAGNIAALWRFHGVEPPASLETVEAPISIHPLRPGLSWSHSFATLLSATERAARASEAEVLIASCGCYGIPLCHEVHRRRRGITCIYPGHVAHALFGIYSAAEQQNTFYKTSAHTGAWVDGDLSDRASELTSLDRGRYGGSMIQVTGASR